MSIIALVAAMANNRVIGKDGDMPWHLPSELQYFKEITMGKPIVMGRNTFLSIGRPLPGRRNVVVTTQPEKLPAEVETVSSPEEAIQLLSDAPEIMVIGGGQIYASFLPKAQRMYLTHIDLEVDGDTYFPAWESTDWVEKLLRESPQKSPDMPAFRAYLYEKST
ncbi:MAG: dihydrofolate reductase FolA [Idiomarinaceae bacterium HL-53]|nr:MAG: dihydrofolate reductase FolA [Idiomarinaceae bacterium HL-53]CUS47315.1 dihydrofolate reductase [Idiomarinaceae bacterium HL-53]